MKKALFTMNVTITIILALLAVPFIQLLPFLFITILSYLLMTGTKQSYPLMIMFSVVMTVINISTVSYIDMCYWLLVSFFTVIAHEE